MAWMDEVIIEDIRKLIEYKKFEPGTILIMEKYSFEIEDLVQEFWMTINKLSTRKSTKNYRINWIDKSWDITNPKVRKIHFNWLKVEYKSFLSFMRKHNINIGNKINKEDYQMSIFNDPKEKLQMEVWWQIILEIADNDPFIWTMIQWKLDKISSKKLCEKYNIKPSNLTYHWKNFMMKCLEREIELGNEYIVFGE